HGGQVRDAALGEVSGVPAQVAAVAHQGVRGQAALDGEMVEVDGHRTVDRGGGPAGRSTAGRRPCGQDEAPARTLDSGSTGMPCASATGSLTRVPPTAFTPSASAGSSVTACRSPLFARSSAYGTVTLVSA